MPIPAQPANLLPRPFAAEGTFQLIPDTQSFSGRASFTLGFPPETQQPLHEGGVAPNRTDFNGMFYMLSAFAFWQQSGGLWNYVATLNYAAPAVVYHNGVLWWCVAPNGPEVEAVGAKEPGTDADYWVEFIRALAGGGSGGLGNPVGTIIMWPSLTPPEGYFPCDGQEFSATDNPELLQVLGSSRTPDMRGLFVRGYDPEAVNDPSGATRALLTPQGDAIRNITGAFPCMAPYDYHNYFSGAFRPVVVAGSGQGRPNGTQHGVGFAASRVVPVAPENRPKNINVLYCIKHD